MKIQREALNMRIDSIRQQALDTKAKAESVIRQLSELDSWLDKQQLNEVK